MQEDDWAQLLTSMQYQVYVVTNHIQEMTLCMGQSEQTT